jgi:hypothetical protein
VYVSKTGAVVIPVFVQGKTGSIQFFRKQTSEPGSYSGILQAGMEVTVGLRAEEFTYIAINLGIC